jgi:hypothetical protein
MTLAMNSDYFPKQHQPVGLYEGDGLWSVLGRKCILKFWTTTGVFISTEVNRLKIWKMSLGSVDVGSALPTVQPGNRGSFLESLQDFLLSSALRSTQHPTQWKLRAVIEGIKRPGRDTSNRLLPMRRQEGVEIQLDSIRLNVVVLNYAQWRLYVILFERHNV